MTVRTITKRVIDCEFPLCESHSKEYARAAIARFSIEKEGWHRFYGADYCEKHTFEEVMRHIQGAPIIGQHVRHREAS